MIDPYAASLEPITNAHQNVARTLHTIVFDPFHRRAALTACSGGVSSSDLGVTGVDGRGISSLRETEGGPASLGSARIACSVAMSHNARESVKERRCTRSC